MNESQKEPLPRPLPPQERHGELGVIGVATAILLACFGRPMIALVRFSVSSQLYSHIVLIPFISLYLVWVKREHLPVPSKPNRAISCLFLLSGCAILACFWAAKLSGASLTVEDSLALTTLSFLLFFDGICIWFLGSKVLHSIRFPLAFLFLMVPFPVFFTDWVEAVLQHCSAAAALALFKLVGTPVFSTGLSMQLPDITLEVAPQCSGIHSSLALFITSLLAGHFFLRSNWKRFALAAAVIPLAIARNGFRIFTIGELCVHYGPQMIDSDIHHKGGPIFFCLSMVPFLLFLYFLIKRDATVPKATKILT
jgi:exosortase C (VPDSG-CTERM-specific)